MKELKKICIGFKGSFSSGLLLMTEWQIETINRRNILHWLLTLIDGRLCFPQILFNHFPFTWNFKWRSRRKWDNEGKMKTYTSNKHNSRRVCHSSHHFSLSLYHCILEQFFFELLFVKWLPSALLSMSGNNISDLCMELISKPLFVLTSALGTLNTKGNIIY